MKALTVKQPWASLIVHGIKDIENRTWKTNFRGTILIHTARKEANGFEYTQDQEEKLIKNTVFYHPKSAIIGHVDIVDCVINHPSIWAEKSYFPSNQNALPFGEENEPDIIIWNWVLANPVLYKEPILNVKGKLSFWEYEN